MLIRRSIQLPNSKASGPNLDKNSVRLSDCAPFYENYTKLYFDAKCLKTGLNMGWLNLGCFFSQKVPFLANIGRCPNVLGLKALGFVFFSVSGVPKSLCKKNKYLNTI